MIQVPDNFIDISPDIYELYRGKSEFQCLQVIEEIKSGNRVLLLDGRIQFHSDDYYRYHECLGIIPYLFTKNVERVLILGGGDGLLVTDLLRFDSIKKIDLVDVDKDVIKVCADFFGYLNNGSLKNEKLNIVIEDAWKYVMECKEKYDLIIADYTDPFSSYFTQRLYTLEHLHYIKECLRDDGTFAMHSISPSMKPKAFWCLVKTIKTVFQEWTISPYKIYMPCTFVEQGFMMATKNTQMVAPIPQDCRYLTIGAIIAMFNFARDEILIDGEFLPVSTCQNFAFVNMALIPHRREWRSDETVR